MGFSLSTIKSLSYNRSLRRHKSSMESNTKELLDIIKDQETSEKKYSGVPIQESDTRIPFIVRLWNFLK